MNENNIQEEKISRNEYIKVIEERNRFIKILKSIFENISDTVDSCNISDDFDKILCRECICKKCFNKDCPGRFCNSEGFKCDWKGREKEPVYECECFSDEEIVFIKK